MAHFAKICHGNREAEDVYAETAQLFDGRLNPAF